MPFGGIGLGVPHFLLTTNGTGNVFGAGVNVLSAFNSVLEG